ncbi:MAG: hypothetical protein NTY00_01505 [Deltaproteobacteria bacterium]|nr:hypothetical protein [Deltaproteobacteria bacterium]
MSIEDDIRQKHASVEQAIRAQHEFGKRLKEFLKLASSMSDKELEIALARLADMVTREKPDAEPAVRFKGMVLNLYYRMRLSGGKSQSTLARMRQNIRAGVYIGEFGEYLVNSISSYSFPPIPAEHAAKYRDEDFFGQRVKLLAP